jgi:hypothetical protein
MKSGARGQKVKYIETAGTNRWEAEVRAEIVCVGELLVALLDVLELREDRLAVFLLRVPGLDEGVNHRHFNKLKILEIVVAALQASTSTARGSP